MNEDNESMKYNLKSIFKGTLWGFCPLNVLQSSCFNESVPFTCTWGIIKQKVALQVVFVKRKSIISFASLP